VIEHWNQICVLVEEADRQAADSKMPKAAKKTVAPAAKKTAPKPATKKPVKKEHVTSLLHLTRRLVLVRFRSF